MRWFNTAGYDKSILANASAFRSRVSRLDSPSCAPYAGATSAMHDFGFGPRRCKSFIHSAGLLMSIIDYIAADQIMVGVAGSSKKQIG